VEVSVEFQVGDKVIYPNHGIGVVESIDTRSMSEGTVTGFGLRILANDSKVWIPRDSATGVGLRAVVKTTEVEQLIDHLADSNIDQQANWKGRFKENSDRMRTGSIFEVAEVLKGLTHLSLRKALSFREKRMLDRAKFLMVSEMAEAEGASETVMEERVDRALTKAFGSEVLSASSTPVANA
jgi:CarD family transcriptional regulator